MDLKFIKTKSLQIQHFPRMLTVAREAFRALLESLPQDPYQEGMVGQLMLMSYLFFEDKAIINPPTEKDLVVFHKKDGKTTERFFSLEECQKFTEYHPLLRHNLFFLN